MAPLTTNEEQLAKLNVLQRLQESGNLRESLDQLEALLARWPDYAPFHLMRGSVLAGLEDYDSALTCFRRALEMKPDDVRAADGLALCMRKVGRGDEIIATFAERYYNRPSHGTATALMRAALNSDDEDQPLFEMLLKGFYPKFFAEHPECDVVMTRFVPFAAWCAANGVAFDTFDPGGETRLTHVDGAPVAPYYAPPVQFATIPGASVIAGLDLLIAPSGEFLDGSGLMALTKLGDHRYGSATFVPFLADPPRNRLLHARASRTIDIDEDVVFLSTYREHHFGHWLLDYLPRLIAWRRSGSAQRKIYTLASLPGAQRETLARFGVEPSDLIEAPHDGTMYRFRSVTALLLGDTQKPAASLPHFTYAALATKQTHLPANVPGNRYFLERSQTKRGRSIANREAFQAILDDFGFETVRRPELTIAAQDEKFSEAGVIITPFGSDAYTLFQTRPGTDFVILNFKDMEQLYPGIEQIIPRYCAILGMRYHAVACDLLPRPGKIRYHGDMVVDGEALRRTLAGIIARRATP